MTNSQSTINFCYWVYNFQHDFIEKVWADEQWLVKHLTDKFVGIVQKADRGYADAKCVMDFVMELDTKNKLKLLDWIDANYVGIHF
jgi:hypothetical protein